MTDKEYFFLRLPPWAHVLEKSFLVYMCPTNRTLAVMTFREELGAITITNISTPHGNYDVIKEPGTITITGISVDPTESLQSPIAQKLYEQIRLEYPQAKIKSVIPETSPTYRFFAYLNLS